MPAFSQWHPAIKQQLLSVLPDWPALHHLTAYWTTQAMPVEINIPLAACMAMGGRPEQAVPMSAAVLAASLSLRILDDMQDQDHAQALHQLTGETRAHNYAMAYQLAGLQLAGSAGLPAYTQQYWRVLRAQDQALVTPANTLETYWQHMSWQSGEAFAGAAWLGAGVVSNHAARLAQCYRFGHALGMAVQILNDLDGTWSDAGPVDLQQGKITLPLLHGLHTEHAAKADLERIVAGGDIAGNVPFIIRVLQHIHTQDYLIQCALQERDKALAALDGLPGAEGVMALTDYFNEMLADVLPQNMPA